LLAGTFLKLVNGEFRQIAVLLFQLLDTPVAVLCLHVARPVLPLLLPLVSHQISIASFTTGRCSRVQALLPDTAGAKRGSAPGDGMRCRRGGYRSRMGTENPSTGEDLTADRQGEPPSDELPPIPDDPRVPQPEDAEPWRSKELGGAAPAVGPGIE
jgi:hypothetical protein